MVVFLAAYASHASLFRRRQGFYPVFSKEFFFVLQGNAGL